MRQSIVLWGLSLLMLVGLVHFGCSERGSGAAVSDQRSVAAFREIEVRGAIELIAEVGPNASVALSGDDNIVPLIRAEVDGDTLVIHASRSISPELPIVARVTTPSLERVTLRGASGAKIEGIDGDAFALVAHGASKATLRGRVEALSLELHGASTIDADALRVERAEVEAHGASVVRLAEPQALDAELHGASVVSHRGQPELRLDLHGASRVSAR